MKIYAAIYAGYYVRKYLLTLKGWARVRARVRARQCRAPTCVKFAKKIGLPPLVVTSSVNYRDNRSSSV
jgi:hypothetical protein